MKRQPKRKFLAALLAAALMLGQTLPALAVTNDEGPPCEIHQQHDADCGYAESSPCGHTKHTADCYTDELICGLGGDAVQTATDSEADDSHEHTQECYALDCPHERGFCVSKDSGTPPDISGQNVQKPTPSDAALVTLVNDALGDPIAGNDYSFENGVLTISSNNGTTAWRGNTNIKKDNVIFVVVEDGVDTVGTSAFESCSKLEQVDLPASLKKIGNRAFIYCDKLARITLPDNLTSIGNHAFQDCLALAWTSLPDNLTSIGDQAFRDCRSLALTLLPDNLTSIGVYAFYGCRSLALASLPGNLTSIGEYAFYDCGSLALNSLPDNLTSIGVYAFYGCKSLALNSLPDNLTSIGEYAFYACSNLALTSLPDNLTSIGAGAFKDCGSLALNSLPAKLTSIGDNTFENCSSLALNSLPDNLTSIGRGAFAGCSKLALTEIPASVTSIRQAAFYRCSSLTSLTFPHATAPTLEEKVFNDIPNLTIVVPYGASGYTVENNWPADKVVFSTAPSVTIQAVPGVTPPARGAVPVTAITETAEYTGTVKWNPDPGAAFAADTEYTATITLSPKPGYSLQGVAANFFKVNGATSVSNAENSGIITASFPRTSINPVYSIRANAAALDFGAITANDAPPAEKTVTVENMGNQSVTLTQPTATSYDVGALSKATLTPGERADFTVRPQAGLSVGSYSQTLTITPDHGAAITVELFFTVTDNPTYTMTVTGGTGGGSYEAGTAVTITAAVPGGKRFSGWTITPDVAFTSGGTNTETATFIMPAVAVTATANFENKPSSSGGGSSGPSYYFRTLTDKASGVKVEGSQIHENAALAVQARGLHNTGDAGCDLLRTADKAGRVLSLYDVSLSRVFRGSVTVSIPMEGRDGQTLTVAHCIGGKLTLSNVTVKNGMAAVTAAELSPFAVLDGVYTLDTLAAPAAGNPFADVKESDWYYNAVLYAYQNGLMNGTTATAFDPLGAVTRAQPPVVLYRLEGSPAVTAQNPFADVRPGLWYASGITWAAGAGLVDSYNATTYGPGDAVTREQLAVMLWRYAKYKGWDVSMGEATNILSYADAFDISEWAIPAFQWACGAGIMTGTTDNRLAPKAGATRAELAGILQRLMEKYQ